MPEPTIPTFGGFAIFGECIYISRRSVPARVQRTVYPGIHGIKVTKLGSTGIDFEVRGTLVGIPEDLAAAEQLIINLEQDQVSADFIDDMNSTYQDSMIEDFTTGDLIGHQDGFIINGWARDYSLMVRCPYSGTGSRLF